MVNSITNKFILIHLFLLNRQKEQPVKDREMIRLTPPAEDVEERLSTDNTNLAEPAATLEQKPEDVILTIEKFNFSLSL